MLHPERGERGPANVSHALPPPGKRGPADPSASPGTLWRPSRPSGLSRRGARPAAGASEALL
eukprot:8534837-Pyramimonas_sp.AAC.1